MGQTGLAVLIVIRRYAADGTGLRVFQASCSPLHSPVLVVLQPAVSFGARCARVEEVLVYQVAIAMLYHIAGGDVATLRECPRRDSTQQVGGLVFNYLKCKQKW